MRATHAFARSAGRRFARSFRGLESRRLLGSPGRIARAVGVGPRPGELPALHDQVFIADWPAFEPALEDLAHACCISGPARDSDEPEMCGVIASNGMVRHG